MTERKKTFERTNCVIDGCRCKLIVHFHALSHLLFKKNKNETLMIDVLLHLHDLQNQKISLFPITTLVT